MAENRLKVILARMDEAVRKEFERIVLSTEECSLYNESDKGMADVLIMELGENAETEFELVNKAIHSGVAANVYLTSRFMRPEVLIEAMRAGVKEFFPQPVKADEVQAALRKLMTQKTGSGVKSLERPVKQGRIFSVIGSKGGVGTTTVAVNLATCLKEIDREKTVALIDMNLIFGEVPLFLGLTQSFDWTEVAKNIHRLDYTYLTSVMAQSESGLYILPSPVTSQDEFRVGPDIVASLLMEMKSMFDFIIVDAGQSMDYYAKAVFKISDLTLIITLLTLPCMINVKRILDTFYKMGYPADERSKIIVNRFLKRSFISEEDASKSLQKPIFMNVPNDFQNTMGAINHGRPLIQQCPRAEIAESFRELASRISGVSGKKKGILSWR